MTSVRADKLYSSYNVMVKKFTAKTYESGEFTTVIYPHVRTFDVIVTVYNIIPFTRFTSNLRSIQLGDFRG